MQALTPDVNPIQNSDDTDDDEQTGERLPLSSPAVLALLNEAKRVPDSTDIRIHASTLRKIGSQLRDFRGTIDLLRDQKRALAAEVKQLKLRNQIDRSDRRVDQKAWEQRERRLKGHASAALRRCVEAEVRATMAEQRAARADVGQREPVTKPSIALREQCAVLRDQCADLREQRDDMAGLLKRIDAALASNASTTTWAIISKQIKEVLSATPE